MGENKQEIRVDRMVPGYGGIRYRNILFRYYRLGSQLCWILIHTGMGR